MFKVFAVHEGAAIQIGHYGVATVDRCAEVPEAVAAELNGRKDLRVERAAVAAPATKAAKTEEAKG